MIVWEDWPTLMGFKIQILVDVPVEWKLRWRVHKLCNEIGKPAKKVEKGEGKIEKEIKSERYGRDTQEGDERTRRKRG